MSSIKNKNEKLSKIKPLKVNRLVRVRNCDECPFVSQAYDLIITQEKGFEPIYLYKCNLNPNLDIEDYLENPEIGRHPECRLEKEIISVSS